MSYMILGLPRSGTNLVSSIVKYSTKDQFAIEPFSMHLKCVLDCDLVRSNTMTRKILCSCGSCHICLVKSQTRNGRFSFKETSLFEYLDIFKEEFKIDRVVYVDRNVDDIINSYCNSNLVYKWDIRNRIFFRNSSSASSALSDQEIVQEICIRKTASWLKYKNLFNTLTISYEDIMSSPIEEFREIHKFLELDFDKNQEILISNKISKGARNYTYGTFRHL